MLQTLNYLFLFLSLTSVLAINKENAEEKYFEALDHINAKALSEKCLNQFAALSANASSTLIQMLDASAKIPDGLLSLNLYDLGDFDSCYGIKSEIMEEPIYGKYCLGKVSISLAAQYYGIPINSTALLQLQKQPILTPEPRDFEISILLGMLQKGICIPSGCSAEEISILATYSESKCSSKATEVPLSGGAKATIAFLAIFFAIAVFSTLYDVYLRYSEQKTVHEVLTAFSYLSNCEKIFATSTRSDHLLCLNGIRTFSMAWVVLGHLYILFQGAPLTNLGETLKVPEDAANMFIYGAPLAVDTFFTLAGLVVVYTFLRMSEKGISISSMVLFYVHRYLRLTPLLVIAILVYANLFEYFGNGPVWFSINSLVDGCSLKNNGWWTLLLYVANYATKGNNSCVPVSWYLNVDTQLYFLSPIILVPLVYFPKYALIGLGGFIFFGFLTPGIICYHFELNDFTYTRDYLFYYYQSTYARFGPYVIGMLVGFIIYKYKKTGVKPRLSPLIVCTLWLATIAALVACVYGGHGLLVENEYDLWANVLYFAFTRNSWAIALSSMIYLCVTGNGLPVDKFLSAPIFQFFSKLSYSMYLVHYGVIEWRLESTKIGVHFSHIEVMQTFWGIFMFTTAVSLVLSLTFESPIIILERDLVNFIMSLFKNKNNRNPKEEKEVA